MQERNLAGRAGREESLAHSGVGRFLQCPLRLWQEEIPEAGSSPSGNALCFIWKNKANCGCWSSHPVRAFPRRFPTLPLCVVTGVFRHVHLLLHDSLVTDRVEGCTSRGWLLFSSFSKIFLEQKSRPKERQLKGKMNLLHKRLKNCSKNRRTKKESLKY